MKNILFISTAYFNYEVAIANEIKKQFNCKVIYFQDCPKKLFVRWARNCNQKAFTKYVSAYHKKIIEIAKKEHFDALFLIRGDEVDEIFLKELIPLIKGKKILYEWDSIHNFNYLHMIPYFDKVFTFDPIDAKVHNLIYESLFYIPINTDILKKKIYDISFVGSFHSDRDVILEKIRQFAKENNLSYNIHLYIPFFSYIKNLLKGKKIIHPTFKKISNKKTMDIIKRSVFVIDLPHEKQIGLTMRTFECLGNNGILVTTNKNIQKEDFFDSDCIKFIDKNNIDFSFLTNKENNVQIMGFEKHSLPMWVSRILK